MRHDAKTMQLNSRGQATLELVLPLIVIIAVLIAFTLMLPNLSTTHSLALMAGMVIFIISFASTEIALYVLIFSMMLSPEVVVGTTQGATLGRGVTLRLDDFLIAIIGLSWLAKMSINKELGLFLKTPLNKPIAYYIIVCLVSTMFGALLGRVYLKTGFLFVLKYCEYMIIYFMVVNHISNKRQVRHYLWAMFITCTIVSIMGIAQIPGGGRVSAPFEGQTGEPNTFGGYLVFMISIATGLCLTTPGIRGRALYFFLALLFCIPLFYTQSRSSYMAAILGVLTFIWLSEKRHWVIIGVALLSISFPMIAPKPARERVAYTFTQGIGRVDVVTVGGVKLDTSTSARLLSWRDAAEQWVKHPILGTGVTGHQFLDAQYIRVITETGFLGFLAFLLLLSTTFRQGYKVFRGTSDPFYSGLSLGFLAGFACLVLHAVVANTFVLVRVMEPFWFVAAMVIMTPEIEKGSSTSPVDSTRPAHQRPPGGFPKESRD